MKYIHTEYYVTYPQWQSLPHTPVDSDDGSQEQNMP
jgi:hypothetical protein